jgi:hypothetical protein
MSCAEATLLLQLCEAMEQKFGSAAVYDTIRRHTCDTPPGPREEPQDVDGQGGEWTNVRASRGRRSATDRRERKRR